MVTLTCGVLDIATRLSLHRCSDQMNQKQTQCTITIGKNVAALSM